MEKNTHKILALKYRPQTFSEIIGQEVMTQTIINSIKSDKVPNAYLLTGIRGVGKTTTARVIAKALNCKKRFDQNEKCRTEESCHCEQIKNSNHLDVLEMDAASKTGIDDIRDLIESSKYNPTSAKYKIFILDEVHMLSKQAFNGLLKTLEEPPQHLKFIFATTEVKKIPVTVISRCQRFDLKRVSINLLFGNLKKIVSIEKGQITEAALKLIAKASEGSVRDSLSLLDRALVSQKIEKKEVSETFVQKMLGLADKSKIIQLFKFLIDGDEKAALSSIKKMIDEGIEAKSFLNDFMEIIYYMKNIKSFGDNNIDFSLPESEFNEISLLSKNLDNPTLLIFWQFTLKALEELNIVSNQALSLEMFIIRLFYLKDLPNYEELLNHIKNNNFENPENFSVGQGSKEKSNPIKREENITFTDQVKTVIQTKPEMKNDSKPLVKKKENINSFNELVDYVSKEGEMELKYDLERNVNLVKFSVGQINISFNEKLGKNFIRNLSSKLFLWTGKRWVISLTQEKGQGTLFEKKSNKKKKLIETGKKDNVYKEFLKNFPDAELIDVKIEE